MSQTDDTESTTTTTTDNSDIAESQEVSERAMSSVVGSESAASGIDSTITSVEPTPRSSQQEITVGAVQENTQDSHVNLQLPPPRRHVQGLRIPNPPDDWEFNKFLLDVSKDIQGNGGLEDMKLMFRGSGGIGLKVLNETKSALELFDILRKREYINRYNVVYLQSLLRILKRPELDRLAIDFSRKMGNVVYFFPASDQPLNGYRHVHVHVEGTDFATSKRQEIHELQLTISRLLMLPLSDVLIAGIEPSSSLLITIMIPEEHVEYLREMAESGAGIPELTNIGVDAFNICDTTYNLHGVEEAEVVETDQQRKLVSVYNQLAEKTKQLDDRDVECLKLQRELELYTSSLNLTAYILGASAYDYYVKQKQNDRLLKETHVNTVSPLVKQSALAYFRFSLKCTVGQGYDKAILMQLLDSHAKVIATRVHEQFSMRYQQLNLAVQSLESQVFQLLYERDMALLRPAAEGLERVFQELMKELNATKLFQQVTIDPAFVTLLKTISKSLRHKEKEKLLQKYEWPDNDHLKAAIDKDRDLILACLALKEIEKTGVILTGDQFIKFISDCLVEVRRPSLKVKFLGLVSKLPIAETPRQAAPQEAMHNQQQQQQQQDPPAPGIITKKTEDEVSEILKRVVNIDDAIQATRSGYDSWLNKDPLCSKPVFPPMMKDTFMNIHQSAK